MVFTTLLCLDQAVFRLEVFSIVLSVCHYNGVHYFTLSKTAWSGQSKVVNTIVITNRQHNTKYLQSKDSLIKAKWSSEHHFYFVLIKLSLDWRYLVLCCLFVITMVFTTLLWLDQAVFRLEVFSMVLFVCHYNGVHSKVVNSIVMTNKQHNTKYIQSKDSLIKANVCLSLQWCSLLYFVLIKLSLDWRYLVLCCLFVITKTK
jgi:hypothetical protein